MEKLTGRDSIRPVNLRKLNRALVVVLSLTGLAMAVAPQARSADFDPIFGFYRPELFANVDTTGLLRELPVTEYLDGRLPGSTALGRMGTAPVGNFSTALATAEPRQKGNPVSGPVKDPKDGKDYSSVEAMAFEKASLSWTGGEVGFMYGHGSGRFGGDTFSSYIMGGVGNDHLQINVGAGYEETQFSRSRR